MLVEWSALCVCVVATTHSSLLLLLGFIRSVVGECD